MKPVWLIVLFWACNSMCTAQVWLEQTQLDTNTVATELEIPWDMQHWGGDTIVFTERTGSIKRLDVASGQIDELFHYGDIAVEGQAGLMGIQLHPDFPNTPFIYTAVNYYDGSNIRLKVDQLEYNEVLDSLMPMNPVIEDIPSSNSNVGGRMLIHDEQLYLCVGDAKKNDAPQNTASLNGKILRLELDGGVPSDNPFGNEVYSYGHRNPQGLEVNDAGQIYFSEHGPASNDELNRLVAGKNYGWPLMSGPCSSSNEALCDSLGIMDPIFTWSPTIAPAGIAVHDGTLVPEWENTVLMASLKERRLMGVHLNSGGVEATGTTSMFYDVLGRIRDVLITEDKIFVCTSNTDALGTPTPGDDRIVELIPSTHTSVVDPAESKRWFHQAGREFTVVSPEKGMISVRNMLGQEVWSTPYVSGERFSLPTALHGIFLMHDAVHKRSVLIFVP